MDGETMIRECKSRDDLEKLLAVDGRAPVFIFKHSTVCPVSRAGWEEFAEFADGEEGISFWRVLVRENRDLSLEIADRLAVAHKSPQVILLREGRAVSSLSHWAIKRTELQNMLAESAV